MSPKDLVGVKLEAVSELQWQARGQPVHIYPGDIFEIDDYDIEDGKFDPVLWLTAGNVKLHVEPAPEPKPEPKAKGKSQVAHDYDA